MPINLNQADPEIQPRIIIKDQWKNSFSKIIPINYVRCNDCTIHQLIEACMVTQAMGRDAANGDDEVEELDRGDDRPDSTFFTLPAGWTAWSSSPGKQDSCRRLLAGTTEQ